MFSREKSDQDFLVAALMIFTKIIHCDLYVIESGSGDIILPMKKLSLRFESYRDIKVKRVLSEI